MYPSSVFRQKSVLPRDRTSSLPPKMAADAGSFSHFMRRSRSAPELDASSIKLAALRIVGPNKAVPASAAACAVNWRRLVSRILIPPNQVGFRPYDFCQTLCQTRYSINSEEYITERSRSKLLRLSFWRAIAGL